MWANQEITGVSRIVHYLKANYSGGSIDMRRLHFNCHSIAQQSSWGLPHMAQLHPRMMMSLQV